MYISSDNIWIFPCANRTHNIESKLTTETNLTNVASLVGARSYVLRESQDANEAKFKFVINGYYVQAYKSAISNYLGKPTKSLYAHIALIEKNLLQDTAVEDSTTINTTYVLGKYTADSVELSSNLDLIDSTANFTGIIFNESAEHPLPTTAPLKVKYVTLQLISQGVFINLAPVDTDSIKESAVTNEKIKDSTITGVKLADLTISTNKLADKTITKKKLATDLVNVGTATANGITVQLNQTAAGDATGGLNVVLDSTAVTNSINAVNVPLEIIADMTHEQTPKARTDAFSIKAGNKQSTVFTVNNVEKAEEAGYTTNSLFIKKTPTATETLDYDGSANVEISYVDVGASPSTHTHGNIKNDGTIEGTGALIVETGTKKISTRSLASSDPSASEYTTSTAGFISSISQDIQGKITANKTKLSKGTLSVSGENASGAIITSKVFTENSAENKTINYKVLSHNNLETKPRVEVTTSGDTCTLSFDGILGKGLSIKPSAEECSNVGDCYIQTDQTQATYRKLLVITGFSGAIPIWADGGYIQGNQGFGIDTISKTAVNANKDTYRITFSRPAAGGGKEYGEPTSFTVTNGTGGIGYCETTGATAAKEINYEGFNFSGNIDSAVTTPTTTDIGRFITVYFTNKNTVSPTSSLTLKTQSTSALELRINQIKTNNVNNWLLDKGMYRATLCKDTNSVFYWNLELLNLVGVTSTVGTWTPTADQHQNCSFPGFIQMNGSTILIYVTADQQFGNTAIYLSVNKEPEQQIKVGTATTSILLNAGYYRATCTENSWELESFSSSNSAVSYCATPGDQSVKFATHLGYPLSEAAGTQDIITFKYANTFKGSLSLSINGGTSKPLMLNGAGTSTTNYTVPAGSYLLQQANDAYYINTNGRITSFGLDVFDGGISVSGASSFMGGLTARGGSSFIQTLYAGETTTHGSIHINNEAGSTVQTYPDRGLYLGDLAYIKAINNAGVATSDQLRIHASAGQTFTVGNGTADGPKFLFANGTTRNSILLNPQNGTITCKNVVTASSGTESDIRLKTNIKEFKPKKSILDLLIKTFDFIDGPQQQIGCIAQDLKLICPEIVGENEGYLYIQESKIVYLLLDEVKKLRAEVDELKKA